MLVVPGHRPVVVISDLHFGLGRNGNGQWNPKEDFRWHSALDGFLQQVKNCLGSSTDLIMAGDSMELWQPPPSIPCFGASADAGCRLEDYAKIVDIILREHQASFEAFGKFSDYGTNRVFFVPGNHDAALSLEPIWDKVKKAMLSKNGRVFKCGEGSPRPCTKNGWLSEHSGSIFIEHGHQIGSDVNKFKNWPSILIHSGSETYVERPWGQLFVQNLFNEQEEKYPIIDNLMPESAGVRYRLVDRGLWGSARDLALFLKFNILETSWKQKRSELGAPGEVPVAWNAALAKKMGYRLFLYSLPKEDEFRRQIETADARSLELQSQLDLLLQEMPDDEIQALCAAMLMQTGNMACNGSELGAIYQSLRHSKSAILSSHISERIKGEAPNFRFFIYGHTHEYEQGWGVDLRGRIGVKVLNTGAFQRLISDREFLKIAEERGLRPSEALSRISVNDLKPCYSAVFAIDNGKKSKAQTIRWHMPEGGVGKFVPTNSPECL